MSKCRHNFIFLTWFYSQVSYHGDFQKCWRNISKTPAKKTTFSYGKLIRFIHWFQLGIRIRYINAEFNKFGFVRLYFWLFNYNSLTIDLLKRNIIKLFQEYFIYALQIQIREKRCWKIKWIKDLRGYQMSSLQNFQGLSMIYYHEHHWKILKDPSKHL